MLVFGGTVGAPFSQGEQGDGIERNRQGPLQAVIKQHVVNEKFPRTWEHGSITLDEPQALGLVPVMQHVGKGPPETAAWVPIETYPLPRGEAFGHQDDR